MGNGFLFPSGEPFACSLSYDKKTSSWLNTYLLLQPLLHSGLERMVVGGMHVALPSRHIDWNLTIYSKFLCYY